MSWVQVDVSFIRNPKLILFAKQNGLSQMEALGALVRLWAYSFEYGKKAGHIPHPELTADLVWDGLHLLEVMVDAGFVDKKKSGYYVHDWEDKYAQLDSYRKMNAARQKAYRDRKAEEKSKKKYKETMKSIGLDPDG
tara:strand:- start:6890 stop:7300 length:411 start_codon:yes stop_codon:yes gene_type:complete